MGLSIGQTNPVDGTRKMFGFVIPVPRKYERIALDNITRIRRRFRLEHPIEIWEVGEEIGPEAVFQGAVPAGRCRRL